MADEKDTEVVVETKHLTEDDVNKSINSALNVRLKKSEESLLKQIKDMMLGTKEEKKEPEKVSSSELVEMRELLKKQLDKEKQMIVKSRETHLKNQVKEQLSIAGVPPQFLKAALATVLSDGLVDFSEDAAEDDVEPQVVFKTKTGPTSLEYGIKNHWLTTDDSKAFLSASNTKGSGDKNYKNSSLKSSNKIQPGDIGAALLKLRGR